MHSWHEAPGAHLCTHGGVAALVPPMQSRTCSPPEPRGSGVLLRLDCGVWDVVNLKAATGWTGWRWIGHGAAGGEESADWGVPPAPGPRMAAVSPVATGHGEAKACSLAASCAGWP